MNLREKKRLKFIVNAIIILGGCISAILAFTPESLVSQELKFFFLQSGGVLAGGLKAIEKLLE
jgi:hypothetical protein